MEVVANGRVTDSLERLTTLTVTLTLVFQTPGWRSGFQWAEVTSSHTQSMSSMNAAGK